MSASDILRRYVWLVDTIQRAGFISFAELNERWQRSNISEGSRLPRTTFNRYRDEVEDVFGIKIGCDSYNCYYIIDKEPLHSDSVQKWMVSALAVSNIVSEARDLHDRILLENIPSDSDYLHLVIDAMRRGLRVRVGYRRYGSADGTEWTIDPYCIKLFRRRWYMLGHFPNEGFIMLAFDRIVSLQVTDESFEVLPSFDAKSYFSEYFGVLTDDRVPLQRVVVRAFGNERFALCDLPLHHTQKIIQEEKDYIDFQLRIRPTSDFLAHILSRGRWVKIIAPQELADKINDWHRESMTT